MTREQKLRMRELEGASLELERTLEKSAGAEVLARVAREQQLAFEQFRRALGKDAVEPASGAALERILRLDQRIEARAARACRQMAGERNQLSRLRRAARAHAAAHRPERSRFVALEA